MEVGATDLAVEGPDPMITTRVGRGGVGSGGTRASTERRPEGGMELGRVRGSWVPAAEKEMYLQTQDQTAMTALGEDVGAGRRGGGCSAGGEPWSEWYNRDKTVLPPPAQASLQINTQFCFDTFLCPNVLEFLLFPTVNKYNNIHTEVKPLFTHPSLFALLV
jgi:hypothetical protein